MHGSKNKPYSIASGNLFDKSPYGFISSSTNVCRDNNCVINMPSWNGETAMLAIIFHLEVE